MKRSIFTIMSACVVCNEASTSNICDACAEELDTPLPFVPEQILSAWSKASDAVLIDLWGRSHRLETKTLVGRVIESRGVFILDASVSRRHAELVRTAQGTWVITDLGSVNGTRVNDVVIQQVTLAAGDRISFGKVGFYFTNKTARVVDDVGDTDASRTLRPGDAAKMNLQLPEIPNDQTFMGLPTISLQLLEAPSGGGGYLEIANTQIQLTDTQFEMLRTLARRAAAESNVPAIVRGFVPSGQLIADLPWDSSSPTENHLKQLVRRVRRLLDEVRLGTLIESRRGFGYRLRAVPRVPFERT
ncbi:MAG: FHA domain-containing protein [Kofleriaceae bacterium]